MWDIILEEQLKTGHDKAPNPVLWSRAVKHLTCPTCPRPSSSTQYRNVKTRQKAPDNLNFLQQHMAGMKTFMHALEVDHPPGVVLQVWELPSRSFENVELFYS